jgi:hypothetical protein
MFGWKLVRDPAVGKSAKRRNRARLIGLLIVVGALAVSGFVVADVILTYSATTSIGANATDPFMFVNGGAEYTAAHTIGLLTTTCNGAACTAAGGDTLAATLSGVLDVNVELLNVVNFAVSSTTATATTYHVTAVNLVTPAAVVLANLVCAYAIVSNEIPTGMSATAVPTEPAGCAAAVPTFGALSPACTPATSTAGYGIVDLKGGTVITAFTGVCNIAAGVATSTIVLYVSFALYTTGAIAATPLNTIGIQISAP